MMIIMKGIYDNDDTDNFENAKNGDDDEDDDDDDEDESRVSVLVTWYTANTLVIGE